jgi:hypothetical protein
VPCKGGISRIGIVDPTQGYSIKSEEVYRDNTLMARYRATFRQVSDGVWFPVEGEAVTYDEASPDQVRRQTTVKIDEVKINDPNFYVGLFHIDLPDGTRVVDTVTGLQHTVGKPLSLAPQGMPTVDEIATKELAELAKQADNQQTEAVIPLVDSAMKAGLPCILDLGDAKLMSLSETPDSEQSHTKLTDRGKGDFAWDGKRLIAMRDATLLTSKQEASRPLKTTKGKWVQFYDLPKETKLPYWAIALTREKDHYLLSLRSIEKEGLRLTLRKIGSAEAGLYLTQESDGVPPKK